MMMLAAIRPELFGPLIIAGSPISYWAGVRGQNPMRYSGGLLGGSWLGRICQRSGKRKVRRRMARAEFRESTIRANTFWSKQYNLYSKIDTEARRYLGFERWWGGHVNLNAEEIQFIVDELFVGNNVEAGGSRRPMATRWIFATFGRRSSSSVRKATMSRRRRRRWDGFWIFMKMWTKSDHTDKPSFTLFTKASDIWEISCRRECAQRTQRIFEQHRSDRYTSARPLRGDFENRSDDTVSPDLVTGDWVMRCEARTLEDIRSTGRQRCRG